jgi:hypothetical protein
MVRREYQESALMVRRETEGLRKSLDGETGDGRAQIEL